MATFKALINNKPKTDGTCTILVRVTENRKHKYFSVEHFVKPKYWHKNKSPQQGNDGVYKYVLKSHPEHKLINQAIHDKINEIKEQIGSLTVKTPENIRRAVKGDAKNNSFIAFYEQRVAYLKANPESYATWKSLNSKLNKLKAYLNGKDLLFDEIDHNFLNEYRKHLYGLGNGVNTVSRNLQDIGSILKQAIIQGKAKQEKNPFFSFKLERKKNKKEVLNGSEVKAMAALELKPGSLEWDTRNFFLLAFYFHGIRIGDFIQLKFSNFEKKRLIYMMDKTGMLMSIKKTKKAKAILKHYLKKDSPDPQHYVFPLLDNRRDYSDIEYLKKQIESKTALVNKYIKVIAKKAGINKNISFHVARHTFASHARDVLKDVYVVQKLLGHKDIKVTQMYLSELPDSSLDEASDLLFDKNMFA